MRSHRKMESHGGDSDLGRDWAKYLFGGVDLEKDDAEWTNNCKPAELIEKLRGESRRDGKRSRPTTDDGTARKRRSCVSRLRKPERVTDRVESIKHCNWQSMNETRKTNIARGLRCRERLCRSSQMQCWDPERTHKLSRILQRYDGAGEAASRSRLLITRKCQCRRFSFA
jgi:hypothetical protein